MNNFLFLSGFLIVSGMSAFFASCILGLLCSSKMGTILRAADPALYSQLQLGFGAQLIYSPGSPESQRFILGKLYKNHAIASVRKLGATVHVSLYVGVGSAAVTLFGFVLRGVAS